MQLFKWPQVFKPADNLFNEIYGRETEKAILKSALHATNPVHVLLAGDPSAGKTIFLESIKARYGKRAVYTDFTNVSKAGLILEIYNKRPLIVLADEIEKGSKDTRAGLLNIMQSGTLKRTLKDQVLEVKVRTWIIATCNHIEKLKTLQPEFLDRMLVINMAPYTFEEYLAVCVFRLRRDGLSPELGEYIARAVYDTFGEQNLRTCVRVGQMAKTKEDVDELIGHMNQVSG